MTSSYSDKYPEISILVGKTFTKVYEGGSQDGLVFENDTEGFQFYHSQDCCENVHIESIVGDLEDLINTPILEAYESGGDSGEDQNGYEVYQWTFYRFATIKGTVTVRWYGSSNGYYSTSVSFERI